MRGSWKACCVFRCVCMAEHWTQALLMLLREVLADFSCVQQFDPIAFRVRWEAAEVAQSTWKRNEGVKGFSGSWWCWGLLLFAGSVAPALLSPSPRCVRLQGQPWAVFRAQPLVLGELISPKRPLPGKIQMKGWEMLSLMAFYPAKCFLALFMTSSIRWKPEMKRLKASFYFCLQTLSHCCGFASSLAG